MGSTRYRFWQGILAVLTGSMLVSVLGGLLLAAELIEVWVYAVCAMAYGFTSVYFAHRYVNDGHI